MLSLVNTSKAPRLRSVPWRDRDRTALPVWLASSELGAVWKLSEELLGSRGAGLDLRGTELASAMAMVGMGAGVAAEVVAGVGVESEVGGLRELQPSLKHKAAHPTGADEG